MFREGEEIIGVTRGVKNLSMGSTYYSFELSGDLEEYKDYGAFHTHRIPSTILTSALDFKLFQIATQYGNKHLMLTEWSSFHCRLNRLEEKMNNSMSYIRKKDNGTFKELDECILLSYSGFAGEDRDIRVEFRLFANRRTKSLRIERTILINHKFNIDKMYETTFDNLEGAAFELINLMDTESKKSEYVSEY